MHELADVHDTPVRVWIGADGDGLGTWVIVQRVPFQRSASDAVLSPGGLKSPTAMQLLGELQDTETSCEPVAPAGAGGVCSDQVPPLSRSASGCVVPDEPTVVFPTVKQLVFDGHETAHSTLFNGAAGLGAGTTVHVRATADAANAPTAIRIPASPTSLPMSGEAYRRVPASRALFAVLSLTVYHARRAGPACRMRAWPPVGRSPC